ncbi:hypothetical protein OAR79_03125 [Candidatus Thioglobus sp.]|nr:hypothetical protein [Candidatus Thioglobus sp.]
MDLKKSLKKIIKSILQHVNWINGDWEDKSLILQAKILMSSDYWRESGPNLQINSKEYRVYSQWGDDGIIQYLVHKLNIENKKFIEFGVGNYFESNTHFLLVNNNWSGYVIDGSQKCMDIVKDSPFFWRYDLKLKTAFINKDNINNLLSESNFSNIGLLHIDLDGNDYWILNAIDMKKYSPDILILEYNSNFGAERQITIPYNPLFSCIDGHHSGQYFGASLAALNSIAMDKGYYFIGCNLAGNNAYFIKNKYQSVINPVSLIKGFTSAKSRDERDSDGNLLFSSRESSIEAIRGLPVFNILTNQVEDF